MGEFNQAIVDSDRVKNKTYYGNPAGILITVT